MDLLNSVNGVTISVAHVLSVPVMCQQHAFAGWYTWVMGIVLLSL